MKLPIYLPQLTLDHSLTLTLSLSLSVSVTHVRTDHRPFAVFSCQLPLRPSHHHAFTNLSPSLSLSLYLSVSLSSSLSLSLKISLGITSVSLSLSLSTSLSLSLSLSETSPAGTLNRWPPLSWSVSLSLCLVRYRSLLCSSHSSDSGGYCFGTNIYVLF